MSRLDEEFSRQFRQWEIRGRGGRLFERPVALEPPFASFGGYRVPAQRIDDGRRETALSSLWKSLTAPETDPEATEEIPAEPEPIFRDAAEIAELQLTLPEIKPYSTASYEGWLHQVCRADEPFAFELVATANEIVPQFAGLPETTARVDRALPQFLPEIMTLGVEDALGSAWIESGLQNPKTSGISSNARRSSPEISGKGFKLLWPTRSRVVRRTPAFPMYSLASSFVPAAVG